MIVLLLVLAAQVLPLLELERVVQLFSIRVVEAVDRRLLDELLLSGCSKQVMIGRLLLIVAKLLLRMLLC